MHKSLQSVISKESIVKSQDTYSKKFETAESKHSKRSKRHSFEGTEG